MIILDTSVLAETLRPSPEERVMTWLDAQPRGSLFTTTVTKAEILYGLGLLPEGARKTDLTRAVGAVFVEDFARRLLSFDSDAAIAYSGIAVSRRTCGRPISQFDAMIASIAQSRGAVLATRNTMDFVDCGIQTVDPWTA
ncbi:type II toxin-antitoxin system VapC family toxin [Pandoraea sp. E26]|uniref:type II toxin-antitoxin system VapC family toxin n=1 Tax=Pandoraea sp. E26 TaxID=1427365 RepID=UPI00048F5B5E|nr:type II toxin-antitoxin system VapC family toxin [Pandoraea sp. E26]